MKKQNWILGAVLAVCGAGALAAETYTSDGFSARITNSGMIENLRYREQLLCKLIQLNGSYRLPPDVQKYDARFFQSWDGSGKAVCKRDGDTMMVTIDSKLGNKVLKDAADYKVEAMLTPNRITVRTSVKLNVPLQTTFNLFQTIMNMPPAFFGRGVKCTDGSAPERFEILPETYNKAFRLKGDSIAVSTGKGVFLVAGGKGVTVNFMDSRMWGGKDFSFTVAGPAKWTPKAVEHPAGSTFSWEFTLSFEPEK